ncbi:MAG: DUF362 domain-containing protein [Candidatus Latescibacterota bacterium]|nr:MAG: DUF362 domain-containing protein [Candidatus Latescibacterota bacterium]
MSKKFTRREFIKTSAAIGAASVLGRTTIPTPAVGDDRIDIGVATGTDYFENTKKAISVLGEIDRFVPKDAKVALLPNPQSNNPGTYTKPEVVRAVAQLCKSAGAKDIACISWLKEKYWENTGLKKMVESEDIGLVITDLKDESLFDPVPVPNGVALKDARIMKTYFDYDVLIDIPITKEHSGNNFTGTLKNLMALNSPKSNGTFHKKNWKTDPDSIRHMEQCIADLNTIITPDLCVVDATEFIITNGPFGPGKLHKPMKVVAGTDRVAVDAYCATLMGLNPKDVIAIAKAHEHGIGEIDLDKVRIKEVDV